MSGVVGMAGGRRAARNAVSLLGWLARHCVDDVLSIADDVAPGAERRASRRFEVARPVRIKAPGVAPSAGLMVNLSQGGAAVRLAHPADDVHGPHGELAEGTEIALHDLVDDPVSCWVVACGDGLMRLHFMLDERTETQLYALLDALAAAMPGEPRGAVAPLPRHLRHGVVVALVVLPVLLAAPWLEQVWCGRPQYSGPVPDWLAEPVEAGVPEQGRDPPRLPGSRAPTGMVLGVVDGAPARDGADRSASPRALLAAGTNFQVRVMQTDLPADGGAAVLAEVERNVSDSMTGSHVLLPHGTRLIGRPPRAGAVEQPVAGVIWTVVVPPDGRRMRFVAVGSTAAHAGGNSGAPARSQLAEAPLVTREAVASGAQAGVWLNQDLALPPYDGMGAAASR